MLSSDASDHCPLLLQTNASFSSKPRFHFEIFWPKFDGYLDAVSRGWHCPDSVHDPFRRLDQFFRNVGRELQSWSAKHIGNVKAQLLLAREVILRLDQEQDKRQLSELESELRRGLKQRCLGLSSLERTIARQRSRVRELREGDANTRYFHLKARSLRRRKQIISLRDGDRVATTHDEKAEVLYSYFTDLLGRETPRETTIDLSVLDIPLTDLSVLDVPFSEEEVWAGIKELPTDRAPGPDGFTGAFYQTAWPVIRNDVMWALNSFWSSGRCSFRSLNNSLIVLLPKVPTPLEAKDFRPISLVHSFGKLISKLLANRLRPFMSELIRLNQSAFIKGRSILDNYKYVQRAAALLRKRKVPKLLLKLDISKAFDSLAWPFLLEVLRTRGFGNKWCGWIATLLSTASSRIILNSIPGQPIQHCRGVRQGDPLSPLLFIIAMDVLDRIFKRAAEHGILESSGRQEVQHQRSFYADDVILFAAPTEREGHAVAKLLSIFGQASGLCTNLQKCSVTAIFDPGNMMADFQREFPCPVVEFPVKYLGLPLSLKKIPKSHIRPVIEKVAAKLPPWHGSLMNKSGRLVVVKSVATAVPIFMLMANNLPPWAIQEIDAICRKFLWAGGDQDVRGKCAVAWPSACRPTELGGLGILDLKLAGIALQSRWLWLQLTDRDRAWSALEICVDPDVEAFFRASVLAVLGDGSSILFWKDSWLEGKSIECIAPKLLALVPPRFKKVRTVAQALAEDRWTRDITGVPGATALEELNRLGDRLANVQLQPGISDRFTWRWSADGRYSAQSAYRALHLGSTALHGAQLIWCCWAPLKVKFFLWLAFHRRLWTADRRLRHGLQADATCKLCDQADETSEHMLFQCSFSLQVWWEILQHLGFTVLAPEQDMSLADWWWHLRQQLPGYKRKGFDTLFSLITWHLWKERNARVFRGAAAGVNLVIHMIRQEGLWWIDAGARKLGCLFVT